MGSGRFPEATHIWLSSRDRPVQDQRRATPTCQSCIRHCHVNQCGCRWRSSDDIDDDFFAQRDAEARKERQAKVDAKLNAALSGDELLSGYLKDKFSLSNGQFPHAMKF